MQSKKNTDNGNDACIAVTSSVRPKRRIVTWNGCGAPLGLQRDRLAVEDELRHRARAHGVDDLGRRCGHVVAIAREYPDVVTGLVHLHARPVELPLEGRGAERLQRGGDIGRRLREHRRNRLHQRQRELAKPAFALRQHGTRDRDDSVRDHRRLPHRRRRQRCRRRDRVDHQRFERALPKLAEQQPDQEVAFLFGRASEQSARSACARSSSRSGDRAMRASAASTSRDRQRRSVGGGSRTRIAHERVADAASSLPGLAGQIGDADLDLRRRRASEAGGELGVLALRLGVSATRRDV